jgi:hypothetical protein
VLAQNAEILAGGFGTLLIIAKQRFPFSINDIGLQLSLLLLLDGSLLIVLALNCIFALSGSAAT